MTRHQLKHSVDVMDCRSFVIEGQLIKRWNLGYTEDDKGFYPTGTWLIPYIILRETGGLLFYWKFNLRKSGIQSSATYPNPHGSELV